MGVGTDDYRDNWRSGGSLGMSSGAGAGVAPAMAGVGISLTPDSSGALRVTAVDRGGPADRSGLVNVGDLL